MQAEGKILPSLDTPLSDKELEAYVDKIFAKYDAVKSELLDYPQFTKFSKGQLQGRIDYHQFQKKYDDDKSYRMSKKEISKMLRQFYKKKDDNGKILPAPGTKLSEDQIAKLAQTVFDKYNYKKSSLWDIEQVTKFLTDEGLKNEYSPQNFHKQFDHNHWLGIQREDLKNFLTKRYK